MRNILDTLKEIVRTSTPQALRTIWWMVRITTIVSFCVFLLKYTGIIFWISALVGPFFSLFGLPGDAAIAWVSGYMINVYSCIAVISTLSLSAREITILGAMTLAAHAMFIESALQRKTGSPLWYVFLIRTLGSIALGIGLNWVLPGRPDATAAASVSEVPFMSIQGEFLPLLGEWAVGMVKLAVMMCVLIYVLNIIQRTLYTVGAMEAISKVLSPLLKMFGLPSKTSFLWIVANIIGMSYGSAAMLDELSRGNLSKREINLLNTHIGLSHSNFEDLVMMGSIGGCWYAILLARWTLVTVLVWSLRLWYRIRDGRAATAA